MRLSNIAVSRAIKLIGGQDKNHCSLLLLIAVSILLCIIAGIILQQSEKKAAERENRKPKTFIEILGMTSEKSTPEKIMVGMASNFIFGFIDNAGLFFGMDALDPYFPAAKWGSKTQAGFGNTYSDALGSFLGTFIGGSIENYTGIKDTPLWAEVFGIIAGCLFGVFVPRVILGDKTE
jgi:hypothetical protein